MMTRTGEDLSLGESDELILFNEEIYITAIHCWLSHNEVNVIVAEIVKVAVYCILILCSILHDR